MCKNSYILSFEAPPSFPKNCKEWKLKNLKQNMWNIIICSWKVFLIILIK